MIYKCKNCGQEYSQKTEYCDCGNNSFVIIKDFDEEENISQQQSQIDDTFSGFEDKSSEYQNNNYENIEDGQEEQDDDEDKKSELDVAKILAIISFIVAVLISFILCFKAIQKLTKTPEKTQAVKLVKDTSVPDIDTYWDNTPIPKNTGNTANTPKTETKPVQNPNVSTPVPPQNEVNKPAPQAKNTTPKANDNNTEKIRKAEQAKKAEEQRKAEALRKEQARKAEEAKKAEQQRLAEEQRKAEEARKAKELEEKKKEQERKYQKELLQYKTDLRSALFKQFPLLNVKGSGSATVGFSVSSDGKLLNRRFIRQSDNQSLNDAMYNMLMQLPYYKTPPTGYKGEDFVLKMDFYNGSYSFSYVK